jgi:hypothetical protein
VKVFRKAKAWILSKFKRMALAPRVDKNLQAAIQISKAAPFLVEKYKSLIRHTGGLTSNSMTIAYEAAIRDILKLLTPETKAIGKQSNRSAV